MYSVGTVSGNRLPECSCGGIDHRALERVSPYLVDTRRDRVSLLLTGLHICVREKGGTRSMTRLRHIAAIILISTIILTPAGLVAAGGASAGPT